MKKDRERQTYSIWKVYSEEEMAKKGIPYEAASNVIFPAEKGGQCSYIVPGARREYKPMRWWLVALGLLLGIVPGVVYIVVKRRQKRNIDKPSTMFGRPV